VSWRSCPPYAATPISTRPDESLESTDVFLRGRGQRRWQRANLGFNVDLSREKLLGTEFLDPQPGDEVDELPNVDGTLLGINEIRTRAVFAPYTQVEFASARCA
jgi:hypothetical protein